MEEGFDALKTAIADLRKALDEKNDIEGKERNVADAVGTIRGGLIDVSDALSGIASALKDLADKGYDIGELKELISKFKDLAGAYKNTAVALGEIADAFLVIAEGFDMDSVGTAFRILAKGFDFLSKGFAELKNAVNDIDKAVTDMEGITELLKNTVDIIKDSAVLLRDGIDKLSDGVVIISDTVKKFNDSGEFKLPSASEMFDDDIDGLFDGIDELKKNFEALSDVLKTKKDGLSDEISDIEVQLKAITEVLTDTYDKYRDNDEESIIEDVSDTEGNIGLYGRIDSSYNYGDVSADLCAGGITGAMAIEYDFDPEDDIKSENTKSLDFAYKSKCVMRRCANHGRVTSKKNYCGGIVGRMDLGSVVSCENYGNITGDDGDYIGGIAGISDTVVRSCAAKCEVGGKSFVGGVVGKAGEIYGCYAIANITGFDENGGAIAGGADLDNLKNNFYVNDFIGGADDISYSGKAQETDVNDFVRFVKGNFGTDVEFCLKFTADGKEIARVPFTYKEAIPDEKIPNVPRKSGYYGKWSYYDYSCAMFDAEITAEYYRDIELLPSDLKREDGKAAVFICGAFDDNAHVEAKKNTEIPAELGNRHITDSVSVLISGSYAENFIVRYLPLSEKNVNIYIQTESGIKKISTKKFGSYIEFETPSREFTIYETPKSGNVLILSASAGIILLILTLFYLNSKKRKRNSIDKSEDIN